MRLILLSLCLLSFLGCTSRDGLPSEFNQPALKIKVINPTARHLDCIITRASFVQLFPQIPVLEFQSSHNAISEVRGYYDRISHITFVVVSDDLFNAFDREIGEIVETFCHEKQHRADDLYAESMWTELRYSSTDLIKLDTHNYGESSIK